MDSKRFPIKKYRNMKVEIIKIGEILKQINEKKPMMMISDDDDPIIAHYIAILVESNIQDKFNILKTKGIIRPTGDTFNRYLTRTDSKHITGTPDGPPMVGQAFTINNSSWHTSMVKEIIDGNILITKNSVYVLHDLSSMRDKKLIDLGI